MVCGAVLRRAECPWFDFCHGNNHLYHLDNKLVLVRLETIYSFLLKESSEERISDSVASR